MSRHTTPLAAGEWKSCLSGRRRSDGRPSAIEAADQAKVPARSSALRSDDDSISLADDRDERHVSPLTPLFAVSVAVLVHARYRVWIRRILTPDWHSHPEHQHGAGGVTVGPEAAVLSSFVDTRPAPHEGSGSRRRSPEDSVPVGLVQRHPGDVISQRALTGTLRARHSADLDPESVDGRRRYRHPRRPRWSPGPSTSRYPQARQRPNRRYSSTPRRGFRNC